MAKVPIFGYFESSLGKGIVGGSLYPDVTLGIEGARVAIRILKGEAPSAIKPVVLEENAPAYDWRELQRFGIPEHRLPPGSEILYRPESLWQAAVELARQYGVYPVARPLRLDYTRLKKQLNGPPTRRQRRATKPAFVKFITPGRTTPEEYVIEFESSGGSKMRIQWKSTVQPDWTNRLRAWRDAER